MKIYINVSFADKDKVKELGAKWDKEMRSWYIPEGADQSVFSDFETHTPDPNQPRTNNFTRTYLNVPFADKDKVKKLGAWWDNDKKSWFFNSDKDSSLFSQWISGEQPNQPSKTNTKNKDNPKKISIPQQKNNSQNLNNSSNNDSEFMNEMDDILSLGDEPPF